MKFRNPRADRVIEGRLPKPEDNFYDDRYYTDNIDNVFVRYDPHPDFLKIIFPCSSEIVFKIEYSVMEELAKKDVSLKELISACYNVADVSDKPKYGYVAFSSDIDDLFILMDNSKKPGEK